MKKINVRKFVSLAVSAAMLATSAVVPVLAAETYADWDSSVVTIPGNGFYFDDRSDGCMTASRQPSGSGSNYTEFRYMAERNITAPGITGTNNNFIPFTGMMHLEGQYQNGFSLVPGKTFVFKAKARDVSADGITAPNLHLGINCGTSSDRKIYDTNEYGAEGMPLTAQWQDFNVSVTVPKDYNTSDLWGMAGRISAGYTASEANPVKTGTGFEFLKDSIYLGDEVAYDITNTIISSADLQQGDSLTATASIVNQVGTKGGLSQELNWFVVNEARDTVITDGITVTDNNDGTATVMIDGASAGNYYLIAQSVANADMMKGSRFTVGATIDYSTDFVTPEKNANIIPNATTGGGISYLGIRNHGDIDNRNNGAVVDGRNTVEWYYRGTGPLALVYGGVRNFEGIEFKNVDMPEGYDDLYFSPKAGKSYVISMNLKNTSTCSETPHFGASMNGFESHAYEDYFAMPYGEQGMAVGNDWTEFRGTITLPKDFNPEENPAYTKTIFFGFPAGTAEGTSVVFDISNPDSIYIAEEQVYEFTNTIDNTTIAQGEGLTATAQLLNQIGVTGGLNQSFKWVVVDGERNAKADGFTISENGNRAYVEATTAAPGTYYLIAVSADNETIMKGAQFTVCATIDYSTDFVTPEKNANIIPDARTGGGESYFGKRNHSSINVRKHNTVVDGRNTVEWYYDGTGPLALVYGGVRNFEGIEFKNIDMSEGYDDLYFSPKAGKSYVISMNLKNTSTCSETPHFGASMNGFESHAYEDYFAMPYGEQGMAVGNDWTEFRGTITLPKDFNPEENPAYTKTIFFGFPAGTAEGTSVVFDISTPDSIYISEEQIYEFNNTLDKTTIMQRGSLTATAELLNQIGTKGGLSQSFTWAVLDSEKNEVTTGFNITADGNTAVISTSEDTAPGNYYIAAVTEGGYVKTAGFTVEKEKTYVNYVPKAKNANIIPDARTGGGISYLGIRNHGDIDSRNYGAVVDGRNTVEWYYRGTGPLALGYGGVRNFEGIEFKNVDMPEGYTDLFFSPEAGKSYVISMNLKNTSTCSETPHFGASMNGLDSHNYEDYFAMPYGEQGMAVGNDWTEFRGTITLPKDFKPEENPTYTKTIFFGFPAGTAEGTSVVFDISNPDSIYIAEEQLYDIEVTYDKPIVTLKENAGVVNLEASVVNQIGSESSFGQNFEWVMIDKFGKAVDSTMLTVNPADSSKATLDLTNKDYGTYRVAAASLDYPEFVQVLNAEIISEVRDIYVAPNGNDSASGTAEEPLATLNGAKAKVSALKKATSDEIAINVIFAEGTYDFANTVNFTAEDTNESVGGKVTYKAAPGAEVVFSGAKTLDLSGASAVVSTDKNYSRINESVRDKVKVIDLSAFDFTNDKISEATIQKLLDESEYYALYLDGNEQALAQWPNGNAEYTTWSKVADNKIAYTDENPGKWADYSNAWAAGFFANDYSYMRMPIENVDAQSKQITLSTIPGVLQVDDTTVTAGITKRWKVFNILEELDAPTEWYIDRTEKKLYYYPPQNAKGKTLTIAALTDAMININNADNIGFEGITFANVRGDAIKTTDVDGITVKGCTFKNIGASAFFATGTADAETDAAYWQRQKKDASYNCEITDSVFTNIGGYAIYLDGGNVDTLTPSGNLVQNNIINNVANKIKDYEAILLRGCGNMVLNNNISNTPDIAIHYYGNDHVISYNEIYNVIRETDDTGAIYCGRNTIQRGTEISYNYIHDLEPTFTPVFNHRIGIYWDDRQTGQTAKYNIIKNVEKNIYTNGIDNSFTNNTTIDVNVNLMFSNGGAAPNDNTDGTVFKSNIKNPDIYYAKYSKLQQIVESTDLTARTLHGLTQIKNNLNVSASSEDQIGEYTLKPKKQVLWWTTSDNVANNTTVTSFADFVDPSNQDYRVKSGSAYATTLLSEDNIDINAIGVISDAAINNAAVTPIGVVDNTTSARIMWYEAPGATEYTVKVATDVAFKNVVATVKTAYGYADISGIDTVANTYYYKITASNTSREFANSWESNVNIFGYYEELVVATETADDSVTVTVTRNDSSIAENATVYIAEYDTAEKVINVGKKDVILTMYTAVPVTYDFTGTDTKVKAFVWNTDQQPLTAQPVNVR